VMYPFEAEVRNIGAVTVENVSVSIYQDGKIKDTILIGKIPPGGSGKAVFTWLGASGTHKLKFVVDHDNNIMERDEGNNFLEKKVSVSTGETGLFPNLSNALLILLICVLVIAAIGFMITRPIRRAEQKMVIEPEYVMPTEAPPTPSQTLPSGDLGIRQDEGKIEQIKIDSLIYEQKGEWKPAYEEKKVAELGYGEQGRLRSYVGKPRIIKAYEEPIERIKVISKKKRE
ncbi:MAG: CARDB domain-containing protein, partial [Candidatus Thermoplasmatota archaeon]